METENQAPTAQRGPTWAVTLAKLGALALLIILANAGISWIVDRIEP